MSNSEPELMKAAAEGATSGLFSAAGSAVFSTILSFIRSSIVVESRAQKFDEVDYRRYLSRLEVKYGSVKTFIGGGEPQKIRSFYVPIEISTARTGKLRTADLSIFRMGYRRAIITGTGGCGKSTLLKFLLLQALEAGDKAFPVFVELRQLNQSEQTLFSLIAESLALQGVPVDESGGASIFDGREVLIFIDGFDEVLQSRRDAIAQSIQHLADAAPQARIILASRPDHLFGGWPDFVEFNIEHLSLDKACSLVEKSGVDKEIADRFARALRGGLYGQHRSMLANPMLLVIMLYTYEDAAEIPEKLTMFYYTAYEALFQKHDAKSKSWKREKRTKLNLLEFGEAFEKFSLHLYHRGLIDFNHEQAIRAAVAATKGPGPSFKPEDLVADAKQDVCLLIDDGHITSFAHRSLQEYFVARFIAGASEEIQKTLIQEYKDRHQDSVIKLVYELDPQCIRRFLFLPYLEDLHEQLRSPKTAGYRAWVRFFKMYFYAVHLHDRRAILYRVNPAMAVPWAVLRLAMQEEKGDSENFEASEYLGPELDEDMYFPGHQGHLVSTKDLPERHPLLQHIFNEKNGLGKDYFEGVLELREQLPLKIERQMVNLEMLLDD